MRATQLPVPSMCGQTDTLYVLPLLFRRTSLAHRTVNRLRRRRRICGLRQVIQPCKNTWRPYSPRRLCNAGEQVKEDHKWTWKRVARSRGWLAVDRRGVHGTFVCLPTAITSFSDYTRVSDQFYVHSLRHDNGAWGDMSYFYESHSRVNVI